MKAVLDTNIFIGGLFAARSNPRKILIAMLQGRLTPVMTDKIYGELSSLLEKIGRRRIHGLAAGTADDIPKFLKESALWVTDRKYDRPLCADPADDKFIAAAAEAKADYLVTNDRKVLDVGEFEGAKIINSREFISILNELS